MTTLAPFLHTFVRFLCRHSLSLKQDSPLLYILDGNYSVESKGAKCHRLEYNIQTAKPYILVSVPVISVCISVHGLLR